MTRSIGRCYDCEREGVEVETRYDHAAKVLCDACAAKPHKRPTAPPGGEGGGADDPRESFTRVAPATTALKFPPLRVDDLRRLPKPEPLIEGVMLRDSTAVLFGPPGGFKSFLALDWSLCVASGSPWLGRNVAHGAVAYLAGEGRHGLLARVDAWRSSRPGAVDDAWFIAPSGNLLDPGDRVELARSLAVVRPALLVIDTVARHMVGGDENSSRDMGLLIDAADKLRAPFAATVLFVHHTGKDDSKDERGSTALRGAVDTSMRLRPKGEGVLLECRKQKDAEKFRPIALTPKPSGDSIVLGVSSAHATLAPTDTALLHGCLIASCDTDRTARVLGEHAGLSKPQAHRRLETLQAAGFVRKRDAGTAYAWALTEKGERVVSHGVSSVSHAVAAGVASHTPTLRGATVDSGASLNGWEGDR